jgi:hypothetical protein
MAEFALLYAGGKTPESPQAQAESMKVWTDWFGSIGASLKDGGNPFARAMTVTADGSVKDGSNGTQLTGYTIVTAASIEAATDIAKGSPVLQDGGTVTVYELVNM